MLMKSLRILSFSLLISFSCLVSVTAAYGRDNSSQVPPFLQVGQWYVALYTGEAQRPLHFKMLAHAGGAWIKVEHRDEVMWLNTNAALLIKPGFKH